MKKKIHLHLVSDSTGETLSSVSRAVMSRFDNIEVEEHVWSLIRTESQVDKILDSISEHKGIVMYTILERSLLNKLMDHCQKLEILTISVLSRIVDEVSLYIGEKVIETPGRQHILDEEYFLRMEAINYTLTHDDGQLSYDVEDADIVIIGASRTSKTPTSVYLAYRGLKVANIPFVHGVDLPESIFKLKKPVIIGLYINPEMLVQIRKNRIAAMNDKKNMSYVDIEKVTNELIESRKIFVKNKWHIIDVTGRSVEESAANIIQYYNNVKKERQETR